MGMVVSKRLLSRSVDRNRVRRVIRETFRLAAVSLPALDLVVRPHRRLGELSLAEDLRTALAHVALKCGAR